MKKNDEFHIHSLSDGTPHVHKQLGSEHKHAHEHKNTKIVLDRLARAGGHLNAVKRMIEDERDCSEVLIQLSAVIAALNSTGKVILKDHMDNCIIDAVESGDKTAIENLSKAIDSFIK